MKTESAQHLVHLDVSAVNDIQKSSKHRSHSGGVQISHMKPLKQKDILLIEAVGRRSTVLPGRREGGDDDAQRRDLPRTFLPPVLIPVNVNTCF